MYEGVCRAPVCQNKVKKSNGLDFPAAIRIRMCFYFCIFFVCIVPTVLALGILLAGLNEKCDRYIMFNRLYAPKIGIGNILYFLKIEKIEFCI